MSNLSQIVDNPILKSNRVIRYSGIYQAEPESLCEHVLSVQYIAYQIALDLINLGESIDLGKLLEKVLLHDVDEVIVGDIPRTTKYATETSKEVLDEIARMSLAKLPKMDARSVEVWENAKDSTPEGFILRLADMLDVYKKVRLEITKLNNYEFCGVAIESKEYFESYDWIKSMTNIFKNVKSIQYVNDLLTEVLEELGKIQQLPFYQTHELVRRKYNE